MISLFTLLNCDEALQQHKNLIGHIIVLKFAERKTAQYAYQTIVNQYAKCELRTEQRAFRITVYIKLYNWLHKKQQIIVTNNYF